MTDERAPEDPYTTRFDAPVVAVDGQDVVLEHTYFYAESGGQPADRGTLGGVPVANVTHHEDEVVHTITGDPPFEAGDTVTGAIDQAFRTYTMRAHTASHALYGAGRRLLDDLGYGGFNIDDEKVRVDFATSTTIDDALLAELERLTNRVVWDSRDVVWRTMDKEEAMALEDIAFNTKTEEGVLTESDTIRVVEIDPNGTAVWSTSTDGFPYEADRLPYGEYAGQYNAGTPTPDSDPGTDETSTPDERTPLPTAVGPGDGNETGGEIPGLTLAVGGLKGTFLWIPWWFSEGHLATAILSIGLVLGGVADYGWRRYQGK